MTKKLTLIGAGPGDPDLITLKAVKTLAVADVVLYDALVNVQILSHINPAAQQLFVGKRMGRHTYSQDEINELIIEYALQDLHVVRLKGGDSFVFGRGMEEIAYARVFDIPCEVIPGITSAVAVPATLGIGVTRRSISDSFWVITGTTSHKKLSQDLHIALQSSATIVVLMGMGKLAQIVALFEAQGKSEIPVAIIQNGTTSQQQYVAGKMNNIIDLVAEKNIASPAVIIVGEVVKHSYELAHIYQSIEATTL